MKFSLFSFAALAASAMAFPVNDAASVKAVRDYAVSDATDTVTKSKYTEVGTSNTVTKTVTKKITSVQVTNSVGVVKVLTVAVDEVKVQTTGIKEVITSFKAGAITKAVAITNVARHFTVLNELIATVVSQLKDLVKIDIRVPDVKLILSLVIELVKEIVAAAKEVIGVLGIDNIIGSVLELLFKTIATLLNLVTELVGDIVPGLVEILSNILGTLEGTPLGPVVQPVSSVFKGLTGYLSQGTA
ncbi:hypothetical protein FSARC_2910 [Fusarium sarcochroum]|uniref:Uncharacterized protein n=1 Tax=Fusarium sarcochroum TaxID=1208366 RepID=A0A8H4U5G4_9HYPO|nr:hypothetical protein FSARC_2910 [Fusarium sarcochroum]